jgi:hypothetical protein
MPIHLAPNEIRALFQKLDRSQPLLVSRIRYKNRQEIRKATLMSVSDLEHFILSAQEDGRQPGGDLEVLLDPDCLLVGHHDGIYWIEVPQGNRSPSGT